MREIKFRGKRIDNGEWVYGDLSTKNLFNEPMISMEEWADYAVIPETVGQYTGLKDKNGVEIYEGDLIEFGNDGEKDTREVKYYGNAGYPAFDLGTTQNSEYYFESNALSWLSQCGECDYYVVGNIHDNPELMEVE